MPAAVVSLERAKRIVPGHLAAADVKSGNVARRKRRDDDAAVDRRAHIAEQRGRLRQASRRPQLLAVVVAERIEDVVGRDEIDLAACGRRRTPNGLADPLRPHNGAVAGIDADNGAIAGRGIEASTVESEPAAEAFLPLLVLGGHVRRPELRAARRGERRDGAPRIEGKDLAVGDQRHGAQASAGRRAGPGVGRPHLPHLLAQGEMAEIVGRRAARLRPGRIGLRRRQLNRPARLGRIDIGHARIGDDGDALARQLRFFLGERIAEGFG